MAATYTKPTEAMHWADTSTNITEPLEAKKNEGWVLLEAPASSWENWNQNNIGQWLQWINERFFDGGDEDELLIKSPGDGSDALLITDDYVRVEKDLQIYDAYFYLESPSGHPNIYFDSDDYIAFSRNHHHWVFNRDSTEALIVAEDGIKPYGLLLENTYTPTRLGSATAHGEKPITIAAKNTSGSTIPAMSIVIVKTTVGTLGQLEIDSTTTNSHLKTIGVLENETVDGAYGNLVVGGITKVNLYDAGDTDLIGKPCVTHTVANVATTGGSFSIGTVLSRVTAGSLGTYPWWVLITGPHDV